MNHLRVDSLTRGSKWAGCGESGSERGRGRFGASEKFCLMHLLWSLLLSKSGRLEGELSVTGAINRSVLLTKGCGTQKQGACILRIWRTPSTSGRLTKTGENIELLNLKLLQCEIKAAASALNTALKILTCFEIEQISAADQNLDEIQQKYAESCQM